MTLCPSLQESNPKKRFRCCCNSTCFPSHCTESTLIDSGSGTSNIFPSHLLSILSSPSLSAHPYPLRGKLILNASLGLRSLSIVKPNFQAFMVSLSLLTVSFYFQPHFVHPFHSTVRGVQLGINLPLMSPTHQTAHACLSGVG